MAREVTRILQRISAGDVRALDELLPLVYQPMKEVAGRVSRREAPGALEPTELVHEAYLRLIGNEKLEWQSRSHFYAACATVIRRVLVDQARARKRHKRGSDAVQIPLDDLQPACDSSIDVVDLDDALGELSQLSPRMGRLVELRFFGGLSETEAAEVLQVSRRTVSGDWATAKAWLRERLAEAQ